MGDIRKKNVDMKMCWGFRDGQRGTKACWGHRDVLSTVVFWGYNDVLRGYGGVLCYLWCRIM